MTTQWYNDDNRREKLQRRFEAAKARAAQREVVSKKVLETRLITFADLLTLDACGRQLATFQKLFGVDTVVHLTYHNLTVAQANDLNITWLVYKLKPEIYEAFHQHLMIHYRIFDRKTDAVMARYDMMHGRDKAIADPDWQAAKAEYNRAAVWCVAHYLGLPIPEGVKGYER